MLKGMPKAIIDLHYISVLAFVHRPRGSKSAFKIQNFEEIACWTGMTRQLDPMNIGETRFWQPCARTRLRAAGFSTQMLREERGIPHLISKMHRNHMNVSLNQASRCYHGYSRAPCVHAPEALTLHRVLDSFRRVGFITLIYSARTALPARGSGKHKNSRETYCPDHC